MLGVKPKNFVGKSSEYRGCYDIYGRRDGIGSETWKKQEQTYEGTFFKDTYHGEGCYKRLTGKENSVFEGYFFSGSKEGYGVVSFPDGSVFEGLFKNNQAFGPGVYTHVNGRQDVGFWLSNKIVRLCRVVDFIIPRLASTSVGKLKLLEFQTLLPFAEENADVGTSLLFKHGVEFSKSFRLYSNFIHDPRSLFFDRIRFDKVYFVKDEGLDVNNRVSIRDGVNETGKSKNINFLTPGNVHSFQGDVNMEADGLGEGETDFCEVIRIIAWNRSQLCMEMLKQIFRFRSFEDELSFKVSDLMAGERIKFKKTGETERICIHFLKMCSIGPAYIVKEMLCTGVISEELMDARGNNSIMFAAAADQHDIIHALLNHGVDVNAFNDENLTPLNFCLLRRITQAYSLGNWEVCFLPPNEHPLSVSEEERRDVQKSTESLDRVFGDGMSIISEIDVGMKKKLDEKDSVFCFQGEYDSEIGTSEITLLHYRTEKLETRCVSSKPETQEDEECQPVSYKREEFLKAIASPTDNDTYFFDLSLENTRKERKCESVPGETEVECLVSFNEKLVNIDKTIELLLIRGADPNLADAPKPSIHLAVYSKDPKLVRLLLTYGASPDTQSLPQDGLLTPLHIIALMKPSQEQVEMCELLLNYGASPEEETLPTFNPNSAKEFLDFLDPDHGRTPLQLLCTRQDAENVDSKGFLRQVAYLLAKVSKKKKLFKGHSYVTLAMMSGNYGIMQAILECRGIDPNQILGENLGTSFHVLVSTDLQKRTSFENSVRMCDLLLENGGDPTLTFETPQSLIGTCIDYGYREIEKEKQRRVSENEGLKKKSERDHLEEHLKVVEYIAKKSKWEPKNLDGSTNETGNKKKVKAKKSLKNIEDLNGTISNGTKTEKTEHNSNITKVKRDMRTSNQKTNSKIKDMNRNTTVSKEKINSKIVEIKKHVGVTKEKFENVTKKRSKFVNNGTKDIIKKVSERRDSGTGNASKEIRSSNMRNHSSLLPERFRQSLLYMFGTCGGFNLNDLLLPYVVLRNGDLYYRFKGHKISQTEQYSLI